MSGKFEVKKTANDKFMFNLKAGNGEIILTSQMYDALNSALNGIESVRKNGVEDERFERIEGNSGQPYFVLKAANGAVIGKSESYSSARAMENGIASVKKNAPDATLDDKT